MATDLPWFLSADSLRNSALTAADSRAFRRNVLRLLQSRLAFDWYVWALTDPATSVGIDPFAKVPDPTTVAHTIKLKYLTAINRWTTLDRVASLGDRARDSVMWREAQAPAGVADVASIVLRDDGGCWGFLDLWSRRRFDSRELGLLRALTPGLTTAVRLSRGASFRPTATATDAGGPAVLLLDDELNVTGQTGPAERWLRLLLPTLDRFSPIPAAAYNVAAQLLANEAGVDAGAAVARMPASDGSWVRVSAARVEPGQYIACSIERASVDERLDLFGRAHTLSDRERAVVAELARGADTAGVAARLFLSPYTVQDHLKSVFAKTGVRSRRELLARATGSGVE